MSTSDRTNTILIRLGFLAMVSAAAMFGAYVGGEISDEIHASRVDKPQLVCFDYEGREVTHGLFKECHRAK
jgi:hypothetical protein